MRMPAVGERSMLVAVIAGIGATVAIAADRASAVIDCKATPETLVYDCSIKLSNARTGAPLEQATGS